MALAIARGTSAEGAGGDDKSYTHVQGVAASVWNVTHNLGKYPSVSVVDSLKREVEAEVQHTDQNTLTIRFSAPFTGQAYCN